MNIDDIEMIWVSRFDYNKDQKLVMHAHDYYQIIYLIEGEVVFTYGEKQHVLSQGDCMIIFPKVAHGFTSSNRTTTKTLDVKFRVHNLKLTKLVKSIKSFIPQVPKEIMLLLEQIKQEGTQQNPFFREVASLNLLKILYLCYREMNDSNYIFWKHELEESVIPLPGEELIVAEKTREYIQNHYSEELRLLDIAKKIGYNENYVGQMFKQRFGCSISDYIRKIRIGKAKELMTYTERTLKEIAMEVGFKNIHHFNRVFKQIAGISPGRWREREVQGIRKHIWF